MTSTYLLFNVFSTKRKLLLKTCYTHVCVCKGTEDNVLLNKSTRKMADISKNTEEKERK